MTCPVRRALLSWHRESHERSVQTARGEGLEGQDPVSTAVMFPQTSESRRGTRNVLDFFSCPACFLTPVPFERPGCGQLFFSPLLGNCCQGGAAQASQGTGSVTNSLRDVFIFFSLVV